MSLKDISSVSISLQTSGVTRQGFGIPIFLSSGNFFTGLVAEYASLDEVGTVFPAGTNVYKAAAKAFSQPLAIEKFKVGKLSGSSVFTPDINDANGDEIIGRTVTITVTDDADVTVTASHTVVLNDTPAIVAGLLEDQITAGGLNVTATDNLDGTFTISSGAEFTTTGISYLTFTASGAPSTANDLNTEYAAIREYDDDHYFVMYEGRTQAIVDGLATTVEALDKIYFTADDDADSVNDADVQTATDTLALLNRNNYFRTVGSWHQDADTDYPEAALVGFNAPYDAGKATWGNIKVAGLAAAQNPSNGRLLTSTQQSNLAARNANFLVDLGGVIINRQGKVMAGEWIDVIRGRDALEADMEADLVDLLTNQSGSKIPYTDKGIRQVAGVVRQRLNYYATRRNFILSDFTINVPKASEILSADKVARELKDLTFTATLQGAIHVVTITGTISI